ncbi:MAG TPA: 50S ribosomal protein L11 [bacterium]|nr:50S ribosomal protein L11 [bacterium]
MADKPVKAVVKLQIPAGQATPAPPVGPALGQHGVNIMEFCKAFNEATKDKEKDMILPVVITIYQDRTFDFKIKTPPTSLLLKKAANIVKGSSTPNKEKVGKVTRKQIEEIAKIKLPDLNTKDLKKAMKIIEGSAKSMGIEVVEE